MRDAFLREPAVEANGAAGMGLPLSTSLDTALDQMAAQGVSAAPVLDAGQRIGTLTVKDVVTAYRSSLASGLRKSSALPSNTVLIDLSLTDASPLVGRPLAGRRFPEGTLVVAIARRRDHRVAGDTVLLAGDHISVLTSPDHAAQTRRYLRGAESTARSS